MISSGFIRSLTGAIGFRLVDCTLVAFASMIFRWVIELLVGYVEDSKVGSFDEGRLTADET